MKLLSGIFFKIFCAIALVFASVHLVQAQTYQAKVGGVCFRFDDYQKAPDLLKVRALFNKYGFKFTYALNTAIPEIYGDTTYWNVVKAIEKDGHELADQSPSDLTHYLLLKTPEEAFTYTGRPGVDHITANKVCLKYKILSTTGAGDEGKINVSGNKLISKNAGEFAWEKLNGARFNSHIYIPSLGKLLTYMEVYNANPSDPDTLLMNSFWREPVDLGTYSNIDYVKLTPYQLSVDKEGIQTLAEYSLKIFAKYGLQNPATFIHPGGGHPYITKQLLREALNPLGYQGAASYPFSKFGVTYYNPLGLNQYSLQGGEMTPESNSVLECKKTIADNYAKHCVVVSINHLTALGSIYNFDQMMANLEQLLIWCKASGIPIQTYKQWNAYYSTAFLDQTNDIFPPLQNDFDKDGIPDGLSMNNATLKDTVNGLPYNNNICFSVASNVNVFSISKLFGLNRGKNTIYISTKGGKVQYDYFTLVVDMPEAGFTKTYNVNANSVNYVERSIDIEVPNGVTFINLSLNCNSQNNQRLYASGFKLKSVKKPTINAFIIERNANEAFEPYDLTKIASCNGFMSSQLTFGILSGPQYLTASIKNVSNLHLLPKNNRFWVGKDSMRIQVKAPDNTADSAWFYIYSNAPKSCRDMFIPVSINVDSVNDKSYAWSSKPSDPFMFNSNGAKIYSKTPVRTTYSAVITFNSNVTRTDSIGVDILPTSLSGGPYDLQRFNGANSITYHLNYPSFYKVYFGDILPTDCSVSINGMDVVLSRTPNYKGTLEAKLYVTTPTCQAYIYTLAASTYPTGLNEPLSAQTIAVFPNPFADNFQVQLPYSADWTIELYNLNGELMREKTIKNTEQFELETGDLPSGIFFLRVLSPEGTFAKKLIKY